MRFNEVKKLIESEEDLFEINMSPSNLEKIASQIDARAGMEFEMIVPNVENDDDDGGDREPDFDEDESVDSIRDAYNFFYDGDYNGRRAVERLETAMHEDYANWAIEHFDEYWMENQFELVYEYLRLNANARDIVEILELDGGEAEEVLENDPTKQDYQSAAERVIEDSNSSSWYDDARDEAQSEYVGDRGQESEWLSSEGLETMQDVMHRYDNIVEWPHWRSMNTGGEQSISDVADNFENAIGRRVKGSSGYHSGSVGRQTTGSDYYIVEPDGSLEPDDSTDAGLEFVSPPLALDEMFKDLDQVKKWADAEGCYTNDSTGLHINVSVPGYDLNNLDYVKLALLLGDKYVLDQFERAGNTYCKSAMDEVKKRVQQRPEDAGALLQSMKNGLNKLASKAIHSGVTSKYTSINTKDNRIEFRSPGGDWLNDAYFAKIKPTLLRFVVAMDAAVDPEKYRQEYLKKLYNLLQPKSKEDTLSYFAKFAAGELPKTALKSFIRQAQLERKIAKDPLGGQSWWWNVPYNGQRMEVVAKNKAEAKLAAAREWGLTDSQAANISTVDIRPIRPYDDSPVRATVGEPQPVGRGNFNTPSQTDYENRLGWPDQTGDANYEIVDRRTGRRQMVFIANTDQDAARKYGQWLDLNGLPLETENYGYRAISQTARQQGPAIGSRETNPEGSFILARRGENPPVPLFRFNAASADDANNVLVQWQQEHPGDDVDIHYDPQMTRGQPPIPGSTLDRQRQRAAQQQSSSGTEYIIFKISDRSQLTGFRAANQAAAEQEAESILRDLGLDPNLYDVRLRHPAQQIPEVPLDIEIAPQRTPPRPLGTGRELVGWSVRLPNGREVTQIHGIGNNQGDANRIAAQWLRDNGMGVTGEGFEVVPLWREA
jgi:hypothetical protein